MSNKSQLIDRLIDEGDIAKLLEIAKYEKVVRDKVSLSALRRGKILRLKRDQKSGSVQP
jgi:hypothetical protein